MALSINKEMIIDFEKNLNPKKPEESIIPANILGFGEISTVLEIGDNPDDKKFAYKRMPLFQSEKEVEQYEDIYREYNDILNKIGITVPKFDWFYFKGKSERIIFYGVQEKVDYYSIGNRVINFAEKEVVNEFVIMILNKLKLVFDLNRKNKNGLEIGIDSQISNWSLKGFDPENPTINQSMELIYIDTSTPFIKKENIEQLNPELFLRSAPSFLVWIIRRLFLKDIMSRYYDFRLVTIDLIANFYKEQHSELIPDIISTVNNFYSTELKEYNLKPISIKEVKSYYKEDAFVWRFYLAARKVDRFLHQLVRKPYLYILPNKIKR